MTPENRISKANSSLDEIRKEDFEEIGVFLTKFLDSFGEFMVAVGKLESEHGNVLKEVSEFFGSPENLQKLVENTRPELLGGFVKVLFEFNAIGGRLKNMEQMNPEEKIRVGKMLMQLSNDLEELFST